MPTNLENSAVVTELEKVSFHSNLKERQCQRMSKCCTIALISHLAHSVQFSHSVVSDSANPWTATRQASLSITSSWSLLKLMSIESVMPSNHLTLCHPLLLLHSIFPSIRVFSSESVLHIRWPKYLEFQLQHQSFQ